MIELTIPRIPPSPNITLRMHWRNRSKLNQLWKDEVWASLVTLPTIRQAFPKARVRIDRRSRRQLDPDNLVGSMKPVLDALRAQGVIQNDTPDHIELTVTQSKGAPQTKIEVEPYGPS